jgi:NADH:ubiquinone oxidoreductase subunit 3 (subunit A)
MAEDWLYAVKSVNQIINFVITLLFVLLCLLHIIYRLPKAILEYDEGVSGTHKLQCLTN